MRLFCIVNDIDNLHNPDVFRLLSASAKERGIEFVTIESKEVDMASLVDMEIREGDMLYRLGIDAKSVWAEALLCRDGIATLYRDDSGVFARSFSWGGALRMLHEGVDIIPTRFGVSGDERVLQGNVDRLGGFPVVIKSSGGSHGSGVRMANDMGELLRAVAELESSGGGKSRAVLRKFIKNARHVRCVVLEDKVIDAVEYLPVEGDFRTNAVSVPRVKAFAGDTLRVFGLAEAAAQCVPVVFGGVDILVDEAGEAFVAEANFPCNFARNQMNTGVDISGMILDYLMRRR